MNECRHSAPQSKDTTICGLISDIVGWSHLVSRRQCISCWAEASGAPSETSPAVRTCARQLLINRIALHYEWDEDPAIEGRIRDTLPETVRFLAVGYDVQTARNALAKAVRHGMDAAYAAELLQDIAGLND